LRAHPLLASRAGPLAPHHHLRTLRDGFSLLELVIVAALVSLLLMLGLPSYSDHASNQRTLGAARTLVSDLATARQEAVTRRLPITIAFAGTDDACPSRPASYTVAQEASVIKRQCLAPDVVWAPLPEAPVNFKATGSAGGSARLILRSTRTGRQYSVTINGDTGAISDDIR
jgi:prepilin-type N-terminal cleavage/methylation domain-containing protein